MAESMLTTVDNPYNPFVQFDEWMAFDEGKGYHSCSYLARIATTSSDLSDQINSEIIEEAINEIIDMNVLGIYQKVTKENFEETKTRPLTESQEEALRMIQTFNEVEEQK